MVEMRVISWFSCGVASAVATKLALIQYGSDCIVARCVVHDEHYDNDRFARDCSKWFNAPIVNLVNKKYGGSVDEVIRRERYISGVAGAKCTSLLKKQVRIDFQKPGDLHIFGYCAEEYDRWNHFIDGNNDINAEAPLIDRGLEHSDAMAIINDAGIKLPAMYDHFKHNNCIGCVKATGQGYWNLIREHYPYQFAKRVAQSRALNVRLINDNGNRKFLDEITPGAGNYQDEPEVQCGIFCEMAKNEIKGE
jgi:hypothetical protein